MAPPCTAITSIYGVRETRRKVDREREREWQRDEVSPLLIMIYIVLLNYKISLRESESVRETRKKKERNVFWNNDPELSRAIINMSGCI